MSDRNRDDYFNLDNFDESIDSRDYRRRQSNRRQSGYNNRPSYNKRRPNKRRNRVRTRNRIVIVTSGILVIALLVTLVVLMFNGCSKKTTVNVSVDTKPAEETTAAEATEATNAVAQGDKLSVTNFIPANPTDDNSEGYESGAIYVWKNEGFELFGGSDEMAEAYSDTINTLAAKLPRQKVYSMMIPNHTEMGLPQRLKSQVPTNSQADNLRAAYAAMDKSKVTPVNPYNYLSEHCNEYIYFKSDHHWTGLGAYYAYSAFADTIGVPPLSLSECTEQKIEGFTGTLSNLADGLDTDTVSYWKFPYTVRMSITGESGDTTDYDSPYFENEEGGSLAYGVFIYGDNPITVMRSESQNAQKGRKIVVVKESYGNAFVPYLTNNFEEVHVADLRSFRNASTVDLAAYCNNNGITDVLFLNGVMSANNQMQLDSMEALFN